MSPESVRNSELFWLNLANIVLGVGVLGCLVMVGGAVLRALLGRSAGLHRVR